MGIFLDILKSKAASMSPAFAQQENSRMQAIQRQKSIDNERAYKEQLAQNWGKQADTVYGTRAQPAQFQQQEQQMEGPLMPEQQRPMQNVNQQLSEAQQATGAFEGATPEQIRQLGLAKRAMATGQSPGMGMQLGMVNPFQSSSLANEQSGMNNQANNQRALQQTAMNNRQSGMNNQNTVNGQMARTLATDKFNQFKNNKEEYTNFTQLSNDSDLPSSIREWQYYNKLSKKDQARFREMKRGQKMLNTGQDWQAAPEVGEGPVAIDVDTNLMPENAYATEQAKSQAKADVAQAVDYQTASNLAEDSMGYLADARETIQGMNETQFGPIAEELPDFSDNAQLLRQSFTNLISTVRENLGPGLLSDTDIALLQKMIPNMGMNKSAAMKAMDRFEREMKRKINRNAKNKGWKELFPSKSKKSALAPGPIQAGGNPAPSPEPAMSFKEFQKRKKAGTL